jgi:hypothetical protein
MQSPSQPDYNWRAERFLMPMLGRRLGGQMVPKEMAPSDPARPLIQFRIPTADTAGAFQVKYLASLKATSSGFCQHEKGNWTRQAPDAITDVDTISTNTAATNFGGMEI